MKNQRQYVNLSLQKSLMILELFEKKDTLSTKEIADSLKVKPGTIFPILSTLERFGYLDRDKDTRKYQLGLTLARMGTLVLRRLNIRERAQRYLKDLSQKCNENVHLGVLDGNMIMYIDRIEASQSLMVRSFIGKRVPAYCTGLGKAILAYMSEEQLDNYFKQVKLEKLTNNTISNPSILKDELMEIRRNGVAIEDEEYQQGGMCFAAPIRNHRGEVIAAISVSMPKVRYNRECSENIQTYIKQAAIAISQDLGYQDDNNDYL